MASNGADYLQKRIDFPNRRLLMWNGVWPYLKSSERSFRIRLISLTLVVGIIFQISILLTSDFKMGSVIEILETLLPSLACAIEYYNMCNDHVTVKSLLDRVRQKWNETENEDELRSMRKYFEDGKFYTFIITYTVYLYLALFMFPSVIHVLLYTAGVINNTTQLISPFPIGYDLNDKIRYFSILSMQYIIIIVTCAVIIGCTTLHFSFVHHACNLFDVTMIILDEPFKKNPDCFRWTSSNNKRDKEYDWIVTVAKYYNDAINFVNLIKSVCEKSLLFEAAAAFLFVMIDVLYVKLLHFADLMENLKGTVRNLIYVSNTLTLTYIYNHLGQKVIDHNDDLLKKFCAVPIYTLSLRTQKMLLMLITRSMRPCYFSVASTIVVSHRIYLSSLRASYAVAMMFHNMQ